MEKMEKSKKEYIGRIHIAESPRIFFKRNDFYQNDFFIELEDSGYTVTIFSNQPLYVNEKGDGFETIDKDIAELMGYGQFRLERIVFHDSIRSEKFSRRLKTMLGGLTI